jgi:hypothetical protein
MKTKSAVALALFPALAAILTCANLPNQGGTDTGNARVTAMVYNPGGSPAVNAKVCFYRHDDDPRGSHAVDSTTTDNNGNYSKELDTGTYNILASLDTNATFQDSIIVSKGDTTRPPPDTLRSLGSISGKIDLQGTDDPRTVFILFMGSNTFTRPTDAQGNFTATNMAKGRYAVTLLTTLDDYDVMDTSFVITAGLDSVIPQPIVMTYTGIPIPKGLRIEYDTMMQIVTLYWNTPTTGSPVQGYNIYRKHQDSALVLLRPDWQDTVYHDSTGMQDITYQYRVAAVDTNTMEGTRSGVVGVTVVSAFPLLDSIITPFINSSQAHGFAIGKDTTIYVAAAGLNNFIRVVSKTGDSINVIGKGTFSQVYGIALDSKGNIYGADPDKSKIFKFSNNGAALDTITINQPGALSIDSMDNIFVVFSNGQGIMKCDTIGNKMDSAFFSTTPIGMGNLTIGSNGNLFIGNLTANKIFMYSSNLTIANSFTLTRNNHSLTELHAIDNKGNLYIRNTYNLQALEYLEWDVFTSTGSFVAKLQPGVGDFARVVDDRLFLMSQSGLRIYHIPF